MSIIERLKMLHAEATPGPWHYDSGNCEIESRDGNYYRSVVATQPEERDRKSYADKPIAPWCDMELIEAMRNALPKLLALADRVNPVLDELDPRCMNDLSLPQLQLKKAWEELDKLWA